MIKRLLNRIRFIWHLPERYHEVKVALTMLELRVGAQLTVNADIHTKKQNQVIVVGRYKNSDYVRVFDIDEKSLANLIDTLIKLEPGSHVGLFDLPGGMDINVVYPHDKFK